jgi:hypothetical protein
MPLFECQGCRAALHFENSRCLTCGRTVGFLQDRFAMSALEGGPQVFQALGGEKAEYRYCDNAQYGACNWLIPNSATDRLCEACRHNRTIPDLLVPENVELWRKIEVAKHYLFRSILHWRLPHPDKTQDAERGLAFDFLSGPESNGDSQRIMTGHDNGVITLDIAEGDDAEREKRRTSLGEPYRTLVGHFRHEIGHYYWDRLVRDDGRIDDFRGLFGDESVDYGEALLRHYNEGPPADWGDHFISTYASSHPWEDFAETWAHYLHMVDALETARSYGIDVRAQLMPDASSAKIDFNPYAAPNAERLIDAWVPLTIVLNSVNRSMGHADLYPFVLNNAVVAKLEFVHDLIAKTRASRGAPANKQSSAKGQSNAA